MLRAYIRSLEDKGMARRIILTRKAENVNEAMKYVEEHESRTELLRTMGMDSEEPMEISETKDPIQ